MKKNIGTNSEEEETYGYDFECDNCEEEKTYEIPVGKTVKEFLKNIDCSNCGCKLKEGDE